MDDRLVDIADGLNWCFTLGHPSEGVLEDFWRYFINRDGFDWVIVPIHRPRVSRFSLQADPAAAIVRS